MSPYLSDYDRRAEEKYRAMLERAALAYEAATRRKDRRMVIALVVLTATVTVLAWWGGW